jgi:hypothetical protein
VKDNTGAVLPGVTVEASSAALIDDCGPDDHDVLRPADVF